MINNPNVDSEVAGGPIQAPTRLNSICDLAPHNDWVVDQVNNPIYDLKNEKNIRPHTCNVGFIIMFCIITFIS